MLGITRSKVIIFSVKTGGIPVFPLWDKATWHPPGTRQAEGKTSPRGFTVYAFPRENFWLRVLSLGTSKTRRGYPNSWLVYVMENPMKMNDEQWYTPILGNLQVKRITEPSLHYTLLLVIWFCPTATFSWNSCRGLGWRERLQPAHRFRWHDDFLQIFPSAAPSSVSSHRSRRWLGLATGVTGVDSQK